MNNRACSRGRRTDKLTADLVTGFTVAPKQQLSQEEKRLYGKEKVPGPRFVEVESPDRSKIPSDISTRQRNKQKRELVIYAINTAKQRALDVANSINYPVHIIERKKRVMYVNHRW